MKTALAGSAAAIPVLGGAASNGSGRPPNIVMIYLDDSGYGDYSYTGNPTISTPNIRKLAQDGVSFSQFYVTTAACSASRYALLTGRYPGRSGLGGWVVGPNSGRHIHADEVTIADGLKSEGYATGIFGKWHLGTPNKRNGFSRDALPLAHGFDTWLGTNVSHDYNDSKLMKSDPAGNNYGFRASREKPLLFQVEQDLGERIDRAKERPEIVEDMLGDLNDFEKQLQAEGTFRQKK